MTKTEVESFVLNGTPICRGISIGKIYFYDANEIRPQERSVIPSKIDAEIERYRWALLKTIAEIRAFQEELKLQSAFDAVQVFESQIEMLKDPLLSLEVEKMIRSKKMNAGFVFQKTIEKYKSKFEKLKDPFFTERFKDLQDVSQRVLSHLNLSPQILFEGIPSDSILCTDDLTLSEAASMNPNLIRGIITRNGGNTSHTTVIAKSKGIPFIAHINLDLLKESADSVVIIDARYGKIIVHPSQEELTYYQELQDQIERQKQEMHKLKEIPVSTLDGHTVRVLANLELIPQIELMHQFGGEGAGLFRSEYMFLDYKYQPSEEEQFKVYEQLLNKFNKKPVVLRVFDWVERIDGIKGFKQNFSKNEFMRIQLRAILRNTTHDNISILFPMISTISDFMDAKQLVRDIEVELNLTTRVKLGCMIEVPSAALLADHFAKECDFLSIGTNDLAQYVLAGNRDQGSHRQELLDPSVIRLIKIIVHEASKEGKSVSICGEIASDPRFTALLLGLGIREFSVSPLFIPLIKNSIRQIELSNAIELTQEALQIRCAKEVFDVLSKDYWLREPNDLFYR
jgi:phosphoenolpyruvate-protein phosphotransferase (PTS system enzyme I)